MKPFTIHHGDCLTGLRKLEPQSIDHTIMDPPYSEAVHDKQWAKVDRFDQEPSTAAYRRRNQTFGFDHITQKERRMVARRVARVTRRWIIIFSDVESGHLWREAFEKTGAKYVGFAIWRKINGAPQFNGMKPAVPGELINLFHGPAKQRWNGGGRHGWYEVPIVISRGAGEQRLHTTQKPLALMSALVSDFTDHGELILDPYAGSGTTGAAALTHGRRFIGWEQQEKYVRVARERLASTKEQLKFALPPPAKAKQEKLWGDS